MEGDLSPEAAWQPRNAERIDGVKMSLGRMSLQSLMELEAFCEQRRIEAIADKDTVQRYIEYFYFPGSTE